MREAKPPGSAHPKVESDGTPWNIGCAPGQPDIAQIGPLGAMHAFVVTAHHLVVPLTSFVLDLDQISSGHANVLDTRDGTFVTS